MESVVKPPASYETISSDWNSGDNYTAEADCWVVASVQLNSGTSYGSISIYDINFTYYQDKAFCYGVANRTLIVKLYVKKGTTVKIVTEGATNIIQLVTMT